MSEFSGSTSKYEGIFKSIFHYDQPEFRKKQSNEDEKKIETDITTRMEENLTKRSLKKRALKNFQVKPMSEYEEDETEGKSSLSERILEEFVEWSLLTKFDAYSKIFEYKNFYSNMYTLF